MDGQIENVERPMRPAAPFALLNGSSGINGAFLLPNVKLRKVELRPIFDNVDEKALEIKPPTQMMRFIDMLRYHKPTEEERQALNISSSTERLNLHALNDILVICGARKGFRFSSQDIKRFRHAAETLERHYNEVDQTFRQLPLEVSQYRFAKNMHRLEEDPHFFAHVTDKEKQQAFEANHLHPDAKVRWRAFAFQWAARQYITAFIGLRDTITDIRERLEMEMYATQILNVSPDLNDIVEAEFEAKAHQPFPAFLYVLIQKYHHEQRDKSTDWTVELPEPPVDSIAHFALYLSSILLQPTPLTTLELKSLDVLLQVVKLSCHVDAEQLTLIVLHDSLCESSSIQQSVNIKNGVMTHAALSCLLYDFLSTVRELRLVPREKQLLPKRRRKRQPVITSEDSSNSNDDSLPDVSIT